jgi:hypothetical protein
MLQSGDAERAPRVCATTLPEQAIELTLGSCLKTFFDGVSSSPIPDRIQQLAKALEDALDHGELRAHDGFGSRPSL